MCVHYYCSYVTASPCHEIQCGSVTFLFLRRGGVIVAVDKLKDNNIYPVMVSKKNMPHNKAWDNVADVLWRFYVHYCAAEGMSESNNIARLVRNYIFYGVYKYKRTVKQKTLTVLKPFLHGLHYKITTGRTRFLQKVEDHFKTFLTLYSRNRSWKHFLVDKGEGNPPVPYLGAIEEGQLLGGGVRVILFIGR